MVPKTRWGGGNRIKTDSQYAGNQATGKWKAKANRELVAHVQKPWKEVCESYANYRGNMSRHTAAIDGTREQTTLR